MIERGLLIAARRAFLAKTPTASRFRKLFTSECGAREADLALRLTGIIGLLSQTDWRFRPF